MAVKLITFKFKKSILKFESTSSTVSKLKTGIKPLGLQTISFFIKEVKSFHCSPVKIVKDELVYSLKGRNLEIEGSLKFKFIIDNNILTKYEDAIKDKTIVFYSVGFNINPLPPKEIIGFRYNNPSSDTKKFVEIS
jgi:hypothetical protein